MQGGRLLVDEKQSAKPRNGQARFVFAEGPALLLTEAGTERRAGVWCIANDAIDGPPLDRLGPEALDVTRRIARRIVRHDATCASTATSATSIRSPGSAACWPTRSAIAPRSRRSR